ncbi:hypothetical protein AKG39_12165 [Acetobacterium bakii]|uniref:Integrase SAM-like N-terminal domain-containing protein n=2 Tax=Acetobacterium bakii TaxID=52689 RepID=A0A0L6TYP0_9FIRM|nr:hypothetical protein [Acetobacterium bakii]KNZ41371.1 hypothetical protein AKG39_12165 [Acetobacterium bakii]
MTYKPSEDLTPAKLKKELEKVVLEFEEKCNLGYVMNSNIKLIDFIEIWFKNYVGNKNLSPVTVRAIKMNRLKLLKSWDILKWARSHQSTSKTFMQRSKVVPA